MSQSLNATDLNELSDLYQSKDFKNLEKKANILIFKYPKASNLYNILGIAQSELKTYIDALESFETCIKLNPNHIDAYNNKAKTYKKIKDFKSSIRLYKKAIEINPNYHLTFSNLGDLYYEMSEIENSLKNYRKSIDLKPDRIDGISNYLFTINYSEKVDRNFFFNEIVRLNLYFKKIKNNNLIPFLYDKQTEKLNIGFVSADFRHHPVGYFLYDTLKELKNKNLNLIAYFNDIRGEDDLTSEFKLFFKKWNEVSNLSDIDLVNKIRKDKINILIDLAGHSYGNRLGAFAYKPAPVQMSWIGYLETTGLSEIDYIVADPHVISKKNEDVYSEKIWRMPTVWNSLSKPNIEKIGELPALKNKYITFGSFNNINKVNSKVFNTWANILKEVPNSKIFFKYVNFDNSYFVELIRQKFLKHGIQKERIIIEGATKREDHLKSFNKIDISLDTFPYSGGTTSFESIWMGVPILTLKGEKFISNCGNSINHNLHMSDWIASSTEEYELKAVKFAKNLENLKSIRHNLRKKCLDSALFDGKKFANDFNSSLLSMWQNFINKKIKGK